MEPSERPPRPVPSQRLRALLATVREARFSQGVVCPRCTAGSVQRWGTGRGRQRYRCLACERTFNDLTGTPAAHLKKPELLPRYVECLVRSLSVRKAAWRTGVDPTTSFRWRHRLCGALRARDRETVTGWVELASLLLPECRKGQPPRPGPPRPRCRGLDARLVPRVHVVLACDRQGHALAVHDPRPGPAPLTFPVPILEDALAPRLLDPVCLVAEEGRLGRFGRLARRLDVPYLDVRRRHRLRLVPARDPRPAPASPDVWTVASRASPPSPPGAWTTHLAHVDTARDYRRRLKDWLTPFCGVATKYLPHYLVWHRHLDLERRHGLQAAVLRWPALAAPAFV